ncbi:MAG: hypothetical protein J1G05_06035 [Clostridiales bacterium]|nr:hypothetical protein [Clostridiales bacterium]
MEFDIIEVTEEYYASLSTAQRRLLITAQKNKNALVRKAEKDVANYRRKLFTNSVQTSTLLEHKTKEVYDELDYEISVLKEQLINNININNSIVEEPDYGDVGYVVDFTLSYTDRYIIVRNYYMAMPDPQERVELYLQDEVAKKYLGRYYESLYNVLLTYVH